MGPALKRTEFGYLTPGLRQLPLRSSRPDPGVVFFESWHGRFADSPRAIFEELRRRGFDGRCVWAIRGEAGVPGAVCVEPGSWSYLRWLGQAGTVIANNHMPGYFRPRSGARYLQTWHGIPLKRIAFEIPKPTFRDEPLYRILLFNYMRSVRADIASWTWLLSPNAFSSEVFRRAFDYQGEILELGYPRVDPLLADDAEATRQATRERLGASPSTKVILYAPTFRDRTYSFELPIELQTLERELGNDWLLLVRAHQTLADRVRLPSSPFIRNVTDEPDIFALYLAADVLVTDYSSVMFDFALTGKPMAFYTYDIEKYRDELRGFYFDFESRAPGPLCRTTEELAAALSDLERLRTEYGERYRAFSDDFCYLDDGKASRRVVDALFGDQQTALPRTSVGVEAS